MEEDTPLSTVRKEWLEYGLGGGAREQPSRSLWQHDSPQGSLWLQGSRRRSCPACSGFMWDGNKALLFWSRCYFGFSCYLQQNWILMIKIFFCLFKHVVFSVLPASQLESISTFTLLFNSSLSSFASVSVPSLNISNTNKCTFCCCWTIPWQWELKYTVHMFPALTF